MNFIPNAEERLEFGSPGLSELLNQILVAQAGIPIELFQGKRFEGRSGEISAGIASTMSTALAIAVLGKEHQFYNECLMMARGLFERLVNICYLLVCDEDEYAEFEAHTTQKAYRMLEKEVSAGDIKISLRYSGMDEIVIDPEIKKLIEKYSTKAGKEKRWPDKTLSERIEIIGKRSKANINAFLLFQLEVYNDASEALHGSFYGLTFHTGVYTPGIDTNDVREVEKRLHQRFSLLFFGAAEIIKQLLVIISEENNIPVELEASKLLSNKANAVFNSAMERQE